MKDFLDGVAERDAVNSAYNIFLTIITNWQNGKAFRDVAIFIFKNIFYFFYCQTLASLEYYSYLYIYQNNDRGGFSKGSGRVYSDLFYIFFITFKKSKKPH